MRRPMSVRIKELLDKHELVMSAAAGRVGRVVAVHNARVSIKMHVSGMHAVGSTTFDTGDRVSLVKSTKAYPGGQLNRFWGAPYWVIRNIGGVYKEGK